AEDGIRDFHVTGVQTCALPISFLLFAERDSIAAEVMSASFISLSLRSMAKGRDCDAEPSTLVNTSFRLLSFCFLNSSYPFTILRSEERRVGKECRSRGSLTE